MPPRSDYKGIDDFLRAHKIKEKEKPTHTSIPDLKGASRAPAGAYLITRNDWMQFMSLYYFAAIAENKPYHLTERQNNEGPIVIDFDFRYQAGTKKRLYCQEHVDSIVGEYVDRLEEILDFQDGDAFNVYVTRKPNVNPQEQHTKDGIHMYIGVDADRITQRILRKRMLESIHIVAEDLSKDLKNSWDDVLDEGITKGHTNWQMYGSCKPGNEKYVLTDIYECVFKKDERIEIEQRDASYVRKFVTAENFPKLSVQYDGNLKVKIKPEIESEYKTFEQDELRRKQNKNKKKTKRTFKKSNSSESLSIMSFQNFGLIKDETELEEAIQKHIYPDEMNDESYEISTIHEMTMALSNKFYDPYDKWRMVGTCLHDRSNILFLTWMAMSAKSEKFSFDDLQGYYDMWVDDFMEGGGVTVGTIYYSLKQENLEEYERIRSKSIDYMINVTINGEQMVKNSEQRVHRDTDYDLAVLVHRLYGDEFRCIGIKHNEWLQYSNNRWRTIESGTSLRKKISTDLRSIIVKRASVVVGAVSDGEQQSNYQSMLEKLVSLTERLNKSQSKDAIMKECKEVFYTDTFSSKLDVNPYLLGCENGVIDIKNKTFRKGQPDDNISLSTNLNYKPLDRVEMAEEIAQIEDFMAKLFPVKELREYMWEHLASTLVGNNVNQTFNIYTGSGSNGKSKLVDFMSLVLGEYKGIVPISLITQSRSKAGGTSTEIVSLKGKRFAVMQEPTKGDKINEGIMKELTGGDPLTGRGLYKDKMETFMPQFKLVVCTNTLFDVKSNDDGTWRRIRICPFQSKFTSNPVNDDPDKPYQFMIDKTVEEKFEKWAPVMLAMLAEIAFETQGVVKDRSIVTDASNEYRSGQDYLSAFVNTNIKKKEESRIKKSELGEHFRQWYSNEYGQRPPKLQELHDYMTKKFGRYRHGKGWMNVKIVYDDDSDSDNEDGEGEGEGEQPSASEGVGEGNTN